MGGSPLYDDLTAVLNKHSVENGSDTPDWILANYLLHVLDAWNGATKAREEWYGRGVQEVVQINAPTLKINAPTLKEV